MNKTNITLDENRFDFQDGKAFILRMIDHQISNYKLQYLREWEKNHNTDPSKKDQKIKELKGIRNNLLNFFNNPTANHIDFRLNLDIQLKTEVEESLLEEALIAH